MERLQEALSRAREKRGSTPQSPAPSSAPMAEKTAQPVVGEPSVSEAWAALPNLEPDERLLNSHRIVSFFGRKEATPFDMLRTKMVQQMKGNNWKRIAITSPTARCGKTTITSNLAFSLARQADLKTIVVEADLRRPALASTLGIKEQQSLARALGGHERVSAHMVRYGNNLAFATNLAATANSAELLQSATAQEVLAEIETNYAPDIILFDTAPLLSSDDTIGFLGNVDAVIIVAASELSTIEEVDLAETECAGVTQVMGVVLNKSRYSNGGYGYEYGYY